MVVPEQRLSSRGAPAAKHSEKELRAPARSVPARPHRRNPRLRLRKVVLRQPRPVLNDPVAGEARLAIDASRREGPVKVADN